MNKTEKKQKQKPYLPATFISGMEEGYKIFKYYILFHSVVVSMRTKYKKRRCGLEEDLQLSNRIFK